MSILRPVVRQCAVASLRKKTWANMLVYDSDMTPFGQAVLGEAAQPYVVVYTDADDRLPLDGEVYRGEQRMLSLVIEMGIAGAVKQDSGAVEIVFQATDQAQEMAVDILEAQVINALWGDPDNEWGDLLRQILYQVKRMPSRRGGQAQNNVRFAARRTTFVCTCIDDIPPGVVPGPNHPVSKFIAMAAASDPSLQISETADIISKSISFQNAPSWQQAQAYMGMSNQAIKILNPDGTPLPWPDVEEPPLPDSGDVVPATVEIDTPQSS